jgi:predicted nuclease with RNAse H fold
VRIVGIDLAGLDANPSGFALLERRRFTTQNLYTDEELLDRCEASRPAVVAIDAPLSLPRRGGLREADLSLIKRGFRVFSPKFGSMRSLTKRGSALAKKIRKMGIKVIEVHPRTSGLLLFGTAERKKWMKKLKQLGFKFDGGGSRHEVDAALAALTGLLYLKGKVEKVGRPEEGIIIIPEKRCL